MSLENAFGALALESTQTAGNTKLDALIAAVATASAQATERVILEAIRDRLGSYGAGVPEAGTTNALLREVRDAVQSIKIDAGQINIDTTALDLNTDQLEGIMNAIGAAIGTTTDTDTALTLIGRVKKLLADFQAEDFASQITLAALKAQIDLHATKTEKQPIRDEFAEGEVLADQAGNGTARTFTFTEGAANLILVEMDAGDGRVDPFGGTPSQTAGIRARDATPLYIPITATVVKVWAPASSTISVAGFRYA